MATVRMIDIAVNFTDGVFRGIYNGKQCHVSDIATVLSRAWTAGVDRIIQGFFVLLVCTPLDARNLKRAGIQISIFRRFCYWPKRALRKERWLQLVNVDWTMTGFSFAQQRFKRTTSFVKKYSEKQFELAHTTKLPMFLHMRAAAPDFCEIVERNSGRFSGGVAHSFTGSAEDRDKLLSISNMYIGVNGCFLKTTENLDVMRDIPIERMMIETDSPYCGIKSTSAGIKFVKSIWPSKKKEKQVLEVVACCKGINDIGQLSRMLYHNTSRVFFPQDLDSEADCLLDGHDPR